MEAMRDDFGSGRTPRVFLEDQDIYDQDRRPLIRVRRERTWRALKRASVAELVPALAVLLPPSTRSYEVNCGALELIARRRLAGMTDEVSRVLRLAMTGSSRDQELLSGRALETLSALPASSEARLAIREGLVWMCAETKDSSMPWVVQNVLVRVADPECLQAVLDVLKTLPGDRRLLVLKSLLAHGRLPCEATVWPLLKTEPVERRLAYIDLLAEGGTLASVEPLLELTRPLWVSRQIRKSAAGAVARLQHRLAAGRDSGELSLTTVPENTGRLALANDPGGGLSLPSTPGVEEGDR
jgi:hypothetical protein